MVVYVVVIFIPNNLNNKDNINTRIWITMQFDRAQRRRRLRASTVIATPEARTTTEHFVVCAGHLLIGSRFARNLTNLFKSHICKDFCP